MDLSLRISCRPFHWLNIALHQFLIPAFLNHYKLAHLVTKNDRSIRRWLSVYRSTVRTLLKISEQWNYRNKIDKKWTILDLKTIWDG